ncbi:MAG: hypothetical protein GF384_06325 [Elusimicrobia bacterium]|nr:hypothetical protein [Elusimicrobiota bacterium]
MKKLFCALLIMLLLSQSTKITTSSNDFDIAPNQNPILEPTKVIANYDIVPHQVFEGIFKAGVVAFHETGVDVEFLINDSLYERVTDPTYNDRTDVYEYWIELHASNYNDGPIAITATAYPDNPYHLSRKLPELILYANADGSLSNSTIKWADCTDGDDETGDGSEKNPYETIEKAYVEVGEGGTVYLKKGDQYTITNLYPNMNYTRWTTITSAPGLTRDDVQIQGGRFGENMVKWQGVSCFVEHPKGYATVFYFESNHLSWFDDVVLYDKGGRLWGAVPFGGNSGHKEYVTNSIMKEFMSAGGIFKRNMLIKNIGSDIYSSSDNGIGINVTVDFISPGNSGAHPDFLQFYNPGRIAENIIIYNNRAYNMEAQGIFGQNAKDVAIVNLLLEKDPPESALISQMSEVWDHILLWHVTTVDQGFLLRETADLKNFNVQNCNVTSFNAGELTTLPGSFISHNHFKTLSWNQPQAMGENYTIGDPGFVSYEEDDYRVTQKSPCYHAGVPLPGVPSDINGNLYNINTPCIGAFGSNSQKGPDPDPDPDPEPEPDPDTEPDTEEAIPHNWDLKTYKNVIDVSKSGQALIRVDVKEKAHVLVVLYDSKFREILKLIDDQKDIGVYRIPWNGRDKSGNTVGSGVYFVYMKVGDFSKTKKIVVVK